MLLVLWDVDGTLVDSAGHGRDAFQDAFESVMGRSPPEVRFAGRTDHQIAVAMLEGADGAAGRLDSVLEALVPALERRKELIRS